MIQSKIIDKSRIQYINQKIEKSIYQDLEKARLSPWPEPSDLFLNAAGNF